MGWWHEPSVDPALKQIAREVLNRRQYDAWRMAQAGWGSRRIGHALDCSPSVAYDTARRAEQKLALEQARRTGSTSST